MVKKNKTKLVIVESPAKARTIEGYLGKDFQVMASIGHIRDLPKSQMGVDVEHNYEPKYINIRGKAPLINSLKKAAKNSDEVYIASDPDREGEAIAWHLSHILGLNEDSKIRVEFNEITKSAVKDAFKNPRSINKNLVDSQQARRILDRLVGYSISPVLWKKVKRGTSAGRVQSVALGLILDKEKEINSFKPEEYWTLDAEFKKDKKVFEAIFYGINGKKINLHNENDVKEIIKKIDKKANFNITDVSTKQTKRNAPTPFTTSTLQQSANNILNFRSRRTMSAAQGLYEGVSLPKIGHTGLITYMRTDSTRLSSYALEMGKKYIVDNFGSKYYSDNHKPTKNSEGSQDAHEAIRPTDVNITPESVKDKLSADQFKLYNLIWNRFLASQMAASQLENKTAVVEQNGISWKANGISVIFDGFTKVLKNSSTKENILPNLEIGDEVQMNEGFPEPEQHFTQPPSRYTEATLIKALEELGIGRPSTYSPTMETLSKRGYVFYDQKKIIPSELGDIVYEVVDKTFSEVTDRKFTHKIEAELDQVETGDIQWQKIIDEFYKPFSKQVEDALENLEKIPVYDKISPEFCDVCGAIMITRRSRNGEFYACSRFPDCRGTKSISQDTGLLCPKCEIGHILVKKTKKGRTFFGCSRYPDCDFASWTKPKDLKSVEISSK